MSTKSKRKKANQQGQLKLKGQKVFKMDAGGGLLSNLGGLPLLAKIAQDTGLVEMAAERIEEWRDPERVDHKREALLLQRVLLAASGLPDAIDCTYHKDDPALKSACGVEPDGPSLATQSTHTRKEKGLSEDSIKRLEALPLEYFFLSRNHTPRSMIVYLDGSAIRTYGIQEKSTYRGGKKYGQTQFYPLVAATSEGDLLLAQLREGGASDARALSTITNLILAIRSHAKDVDLTFVMDTGFNEHHILDLLEEEKVKYVIGYPATSAVMVKFKNVLKAVEKEFREKFGEPRYKGKTGGEDWQKEHERIRSLPEEERAKAEAESASRRVRYLYGDKYEGASWDDERTLIVRADYSDKGLDVRCVVSNMDGASAQEIYEEHYCKRAGVEATIKENKSHCKVPLSCQKFTANQFRFFLQGLAYMLMHEMRKLLPEVRRRISIASLCQRILKVPVQIFSTPRQIHWRLSSVHPESLTILKMSHKLQARTA